ncbi:MAG TPA: ABC transporter ATP-binding protein [Frankiaceae bacterium]|jgi:branched-chain amino acid transport system ATP-binding protein|nr:ABC transporter ATP-binding protein [Frankiaceae bacterium]
MSEPLLEVEDISVSYGAVAALRGISLTVGDGEIVTLLGANGAGKTTSLRSISALLALTKGEVRFRGQRIDRMPPHKVVALGIGHVPEGRRVFPRMSIMENLEIGAYLDKRNFTTDSERVFSLFPVLAERRKQQAGTLSGGEQQMLAIGRALMSRPKLLLLDEPSMGLAPLIVAQIFSIIRQINEQGTSVLLVEQNAAQALKYASRGYVLANGEIVLARSSAELLADERVRAAYLGEGEQAG